MGNQSASESVNDNGETRIARGEIVKAILLALGVAGVLAVGFTCPNLLQLVPAPYRKRYTANSIKRAVYRLDKKGWIVARHTAGGWRISLTKQGYEEFLAYDLGQKYLTKPKKWDGKWRLLIFDIPEKRKFIREKIRSFLRSVGFVRLQDSVWVYPYPCKDVLELLRTRYRVRGEALYVEASSIDRDLWLRRDFSLGD